MAVYFIGYDLTRKQFQSYENLISAIKAYKTYWGNLDSTWLIESTQSCSQIRDNLKQHIHSDDRLLVIRVQNEAAWTGSFSDTASEWLKNTLARA
ncbi:MULTISPECIES: hypothetical protein [Burkholderia]|uniref:hypothetical protein n=1 Tax=Burkholderia TaxID=32008 RepID=UPI001CF4A505|nr:MULTISPECIES: hypothetical protein [Burkholderia]MCA7985175.1 hypothetical protein [Burkholderia vietnamiensis]UEP42743.1 hypothetical protein LMA02_07255 [Burkholderia sp. B21-005]